MSQTETTVGITLPCPCCGEEESSISLHLDDCSMTCRNCDGEFTLGTIRAIMARWGRVVTWIEAMPKDE